MKPKVNMKKWECNANGLKKRLNLDKPAGALKIQLDVGY